MMHGTEPHDTEALGSHWPATFGHERPTWLRDMDPGVALIPKDSRCVLDVDCGDGDETLAIAERCGASTEVMGIARDPTTVHEARQRLRHVALNARFAVGDPLMLPFADATFDVVRASELAPEADQVRDVVEELLRVLAGAGMLLLQTPRGADAISVDRWLSLFGPDIARRGLAEYAVIRRSGRVLLRATKCDARGESL